VNLDQHGTLTVRSSAKWFDLERSGVKPNTVRVVGEDELAMCKQATTIRVEQEPCPTCGAYRPPSTFMRAITGVFDITEEFRDKFVDVDCDQRVVVITWEA
jgi:hypothetical protein